MLTCRLGSSVRHANSEVTEPALGLLSSQPFHGSVPISFNCVQPAAILTHRLLEHFLASSIMDIFLLLQKDEV